MTLEEKLLLIKNAAAKSAREQALDRELAYLARRAQRRKQLPAERAPRGIEEYVEGRTERNDFGEFFVARQGLPFGRPYGSLRIGDIAGASLEALNIFLRPARNGTGSLSLPAQAGLPEPSRLAFLDTETTGLAGGTGTVAFLIGVASVEAGQFVVRQFFLRDYPEEKAALAALAEVLGRAEGLVTFNGKTFDVPLLETRYTLARMKSPFSRLLHLDMLHPARQMWKLRLESCALADLERQVLDIRREGDVAGSEIPQIYFDYLRSGDARGLAPVFYHNALDVLSLAALAVVLARVIQGEERSASAPHSGLDLYSLSRIFRRAGHSEKSFVAREQALASGLPASVETRALWDQAADHKKRRRHAQAVEIWTEIIRREPPYGPGPSGGGPTSSPALSDGRAPLAIHAYEELAIHFEHRVCDPRQALAFTEEALECLRRSPHPSSLLHRFNRRRQRLERKAGAA